MSWQHFIEFAQKELAAHHVGASVGEISNEVNRILESHRRPMQKVAMGGTGQHLRLQFDVKGCSREQGQLLRQFQGSSVLRSAVSLGRVERE